MKDCQCGRGHVPGRACTPEEKVRVLRRLFALWMQCPQMRLGQLIACEFYQSDLFATEDDRLLDRVSKRVEVNRVR